MEVCNVKRLTITAGSLTKIEQHENSSRRYVTVVGDREIRTATKTNQIAGLWKKFHNVSFGEVIFFCVQECSA